MRFRGFGDKLILILGDLVALGFAFWIAFFFRELFDVDRGLIFSINIFPFVILFFIWIVVFFVFGLYERRAVSTTTGLFARLLRLQIGNGVIAALFFYFVPVFGIAPKTLLVFNIVTSFATLFFWRSVVIKVLGRGKKEMVLLVGENMEEIKCEMETHPFYSYAVTAVPEWDHIVAEMVRNEKIKTIICNPLKLEKSGSGRDLAELIFRGVHIIDRRDLYEDVTSRIPLSFISESWILRHIALPQRSYDIAKRVMDITIALPLALLSLIAYPFVIIVIKFQDGGPIFYERTRVGQMNRLFKMRKFRSMTGTDLGNEVLQTKLAITPIGTVLRKTRLDELPQLWNVIRGDLSLIGPRPEFPELVTEYTKAIPYYNLRHIVKPGLSGWAQVYHENHPHHGTAIEQTREKLSYDLYYVKNRSIFLDLSIALKTIRTLLSRSGA